MIRVAKAEGWSAVPPDECGQSPTVVRRAQRAESRARSVRDASEQSLPAQAWNVFIDEAPRAETELQHHRDAATLSIPGGSF